MYGNSGTTALPPLLLHNILAQIATDHHITPRCSEVVQGPRALASFAPLRPAVCFSCDVCALEKGRKSREAL